MTAWRTLRGVRALICHAWGTSGFMEVVHSGAAFLQKSNLLFVARAGAKVLGRSKVPKGGRPDP